VSEAGNRTDVVDNFLDETGWVSRPREVRFLAAGEYNENYAITSGDTTTVFRINHGTQLGIKDQISYEFAVLQALQRSGVTPAPLFVCRYHSAFPRGALLMEYLPGRPLDYRTDSTGAAECFARIHAVPMPQGSTPRPLIRQLDPINDILSECDELLGRYTNHPQKELLPRIRRYFDSVQRLSESDAAHFADEQPCITNTEVNSGNFLVDGECIRLVDWEKAVVSYRYQDLGHFLVPTTTLWKTDFRFTADQRHKFLKHYHDASGVPVPFGLLDKRTALLEQTILLRAFSWCYMAAAEYGSGARELTNKRTWATITSYLENMEAFLGV